jgi:O-antigen ligase
VWKIAALLVMIGGISAAFRADSAIGDLETVGRLVFLFTLWPWLALTVVDSYDRAWKAVWLFPFGAALSGLAALLQLHAGLHIPGSYTFVGRAPGLTQDVNDQGAVLASAFPLGVGALLYRLNARRLLNVLIVVFIGIGLVLSGSVTGMISAVVGAVVLALRGRSGSRFLAGMAVVVVAFVVGEHLLGRGSLSPIQRFDAATGNPAVNGQGSFSARLQTWSFAWKGIVQDPLIGRGLDPTSETTPIGLGAHNMILLTWWGGGLCTLVGLAAAAGLALREGWHRSNQSLKEITFASFVSAITFSMTGPVLFDRFFWFPALMILVVVRLPKLSTDARDEIRLHVKSQLDLESTDGRMQAKDS